MKTVYNKDCSDCIEIPSGICEKHFFEWEESMEKEKKNHFSNKSMINKDLLLD